MRKINLTKTNIESDSMPRLGYRILEISRYSGEPCRLCFSNSFGRSQCFVIREPQSFIISEYEREYGFSISNFQFKYLNNECSFFCDLK
jgi:hypothetical protein